MGASNNKLGTRFEEKIHNVADSTWQTSSAGKAGESLTTLLAGLRCVLAPNARCPAHP